MRIIVIPNRNIKILLVILEINKIGTKHHTDKYIFLISYVVHVV